MNFGDLLFFILSLYGYKCEKCNQFMKFCHCNKKAVAL